MPIPSWPQCLDLPLGKKCRHANWWARSREKSSPWRRGASMGGGKLHGIPRSKFASGDTKCTSSSDARGQPGAECDTRTRVSCRFGFYLSPIMGFQRTMKRMKSRSITLSPQTTVVMCVVETGHRFQNYNIM